MKRRDVLKIMAGATLLPLFSITKSSKDLIGKTFKDKIIEGGEFNSIANCQFINCYFEKPLMCKTLNNCYFNNCWAETFGICIDNSREMGIIWGNYGKGGKISISNMSVIPNKQLLYSINNIVMQHS